MGYSKIESITLENFMGYEKGTVVFDESGILNFKGYNGAGKSAFLTGLGVCFMNLYPNKQVNYIRHGEKYFRIIVKFDDGITIVRDKYISGQSLYEMYQDDTCIFTTKAGDKFTKVTEVPETIRNYLGLVNSEIGYLNYQVRRDPLWLIDTKGSENYASLHEILKSEEISRANALINSDKNALNESVVRVEAERNNVMNELSTISDVGEELLARLYERENRVQGMLAQLTSIKSLFDLAVDYSQCKVAPEVKVVDETKIESLEGIIRDITAIKDIKVFPKDIESIGFEKLSGIQDVQSEVNQYDSTLKEGNHFGVDVEKIANPEQENELLALIKILSDYRNDVTSYKECVSNEKACISERKSLMDAAEAEGMKFAVCENCGTLMMV